MVTKMVRWSSSKEHTGQDGVGVLSKAEPPMTSWIWVGREQRSTGT
jgi:hypothetical protein